MKRYTIIVSTLIITSLLIFLISKSYSDLNISNTKKYPYKEILGADDDNDGVRDDIQAQIIKKIPNDPEKRAIVMLMAVAMRSKLEKVLNNPKTTYKELGFEASLMSYSVKLFVRNSVHTDLSIDQIDMWSNNTQERYIANQKADQIFDGQAFPHEDYEQHLNLCKKTYETLLEREKNRHK